MGVPLCPEVKCAGEETGLMAGTTRAGVNAMEHDFKLIAPHINRLLGCYEGIQNPVQPGAELMMALDPLFKAMADLAPYKKNDEAKGIWITVPRGDITDWGDYEEEKEAGEVDSYEEFEQIWLDYYPNETEWYYVSISENKPDSNWKYRGLSVASRNKHYLVINADLKEGVREQTWYNEEPAIELCKLILPAVEHSMAMLREGAYNKMVEEHLPYQHRTGVIPRKVEWEYYPSAKENVFEGLSDKTFLAFKSFIEENDSDHIGRMKSFTANDFFRACAEGYRACGYEGTDLTPVEKYLKHADGRDEGLTGTGHGLNEGPGIDFDDPKAWDQWYFHREQCGGHPWEVCRGGNSTHIDLYVCHDENHLGFQLRSGQITEEEYNKKMANAGYYFSVRGKSWGRSVEAVNFFVAIREAGYPVKLEDAEGILARFEGTDLIGIVPENCPTRYCESRFPEKYGTILDFMHVDDEDMENFGDQIEWLPEDPAVLIKKGEDSDDGSQTEAD